MASVSVSGDGFAVIGIVVGDDAVGIGRFVTPNVMQGAVRSGAVIIVCIVVARRRRDGIGSAMHVAAVVGCIDGRVGSISDGVKAAEGFDEGQAEEDDEQRGDAMMGRARSRV